MKKSEHDLLHIESIVKDDWLLTIIHALYYRFVCDCRKALVYKTKPEHQLIKTVDYWKADLSFYKPPGRMAISGTVSIAFRTVFTDWKDLHALSPQIKEKEGTYTPVWRYAFLSTLLKLLQIPERVQCLCVPVFDTRRRIQASLDEKESICNCFYRGLFFFFLFLIFFSGMIVVAVYLMHRHKLACLLGLLLGITAILGITLFYLGAHFVYDKVRDYTLGDNRRYQKRTNNFMRSINKLKSLELQQQFKRRLIYDDMESYIYFVDAVYHQTRKNQTKSKYIPQEISQLIAGYAGMRNDFEKEKSTIKSLFGNLQKSDLMTKEAYSAYCNYCRPGDIQTIYKTLFKQLREYLSAIGLSDHESLGNRILLDNFSSISMFLDNESFQRTNFAHLLSVIFYDDEEYEDLEKVKKISQNLKECRSIGEQTHYIEELFQLQSKHRASVSLI
jgi:hypothetical protein